MKAALAANPAQYSISQSLSSAQTALSAAKNAMDKAWSMYQTAKNGSSSSGSSGSTTQNPDDSNSWNGEYDYAVDDDTSILGIDSVIILLRFALSEYILANLQVVGEYQDSITNDNRRVESGNDTDDTMYNYWAGMPTYNWCGYFVQYVMVESIGGEYDFETQPSTYQYNTEVSSDIQTLSTDGYRPYSGDIFYYYTANENGQQVEGTRSHIGLVLGSDEEYMYTIEGNVDGTVQLIKREYKEVEDLHFVINNASVYNALDLTEYSFIYDGESNLSND